MPTNDGYSPFGIGLTASQAKTAINRAYNLSTELLGYVGYIDSSLIPQLNPIPTLLMGVKEGDIWHKTTDGKMYRAWVDTSNPLNRVLVFFEV